MFNNIELSFSFTILIMATYREKCPYDKMMKLFNMIHTYGKNTDVEQFKQIIESIDSYYLDHVFYKDGDTILHTICRNGVHNCIPIIASKNINLDVLSIDASTYMRILEDEKIWNVDPVVSEELLTTDNSLYMNGKYVDIMKNNK